MSKNAEPKLVSIIIPCFNQGQYLYEITDSILAQTYPNFEIIVVNDGSTDILTNKILASFERPFTRVIHQKNMGLAEARNNGMLAAHGSYLLPLDCDDKITPDYLELTVSELEKNRQVAIVYSNIKVFGAYDDRVELKQTDLLNLLVRNDVSVTALFKRNVFEAIRWINKHGYNPNMKQGYEDWDFWISAAAQGFNFKHLDLDIFCYRRSGSSMIDNAKKYNTQLIAQIMDNHKQEFEKHHTEVILKLQDEIEHKTQKEHKLLNDIKEYQHRTDSPFWLFKRLILVVLRKIGIIKR